MAEVKQDRRVQRTRETLRSAMTSLIQERGFEAITVQDIIDRANVGRSTFYSHYRSKDDLLRGAVELMRSSLRKFQLRAPVRGQSSEERLFAFSRELFAHAHEHRDVFRAMMGKRSGAQFQQHLHRMLADLVRSDVESMGSRKSRQPSRVEAVVQYVTGGLVGLLISWTDEIKQLSIDEVDALFRRMAIPAAQAGLR